MNSRKFKVKLEQELEITLNMDSHTKETIDQYKEFWGYDFDNSEDAIRDIVEHIAYNYQRDGYFDQDAEGLAYEGFKGKDKGTIFNVTEVK